MTAPKVGDRVHVEFDGVVAYVSPSGDCLDVSVTDSAQKVSAHINHCTVLVPPVKVGDVVTEHNIKQLGAYAVVAYPKGPAYTLSNGRWRYGGSGGSVEVDNLVGAVVLRIGDGS